MTATDWIGFTGVTLLLVAFLLNLTGILKENLIYLLMNVLGVLFKMSRGGKVRKPVIIYSKPIS
jgi:hypothetical protein